MVPLFHSFERGVVEKTVLVFAKPIEDQNVALEAGAKKAGGLDLIDDIAKVGLLFTNKVGCFMKDKYKWIPLEGDVRPSSIAKTGLLSTQTSN